MLNHPSERTAYSLITDAKLCTRKHDISHQLTVRCLSTRRGSGLHAAASHYSKWREAVRKQGPVSHHQLLPGPTRHAYTSVRGASATGTQASLWPRCIPHVPRLCVQPSGIRQSALQLGMPVKARFQLRQLMPRLSESSVESPRLSCGQRLYHAWRRALHAPPPHTLAHFGSSSLHR